MNFVETVRVEFIMKKEQLKPGKKYLRKRKTEIDGIVREAERWLRCEELTVDGCYFSRDFEESIFMTDEEIKEELFVSA